MTTHSLATKCALVTGASRGIGLAIARALHQAGAEVWMNARSREVLDQEVLARGERAFSLAADLATPEGRAAFGRLLHGTRCETPDILVLNAGAFHIGAIGELPITQADEMFATNLIAPYHLLHRFVPAMRARGSGHIVTVGSVADRHPYPGNGAYAASKFGLRALHHVVSDECRGSGVRTTLISPGPVDTEAWDPIQPETRPGFPSRQQMLSPTDVADALVWSVTRPLHVEVDELRLRYS